MTFGMSEATLVSRIWPQTFLYEASDGRIKDPISLNDILLSNNWQREKLRVWNISIFDSVVWSFPTWIGWYYIYFIAAIVWLSLHYNHCMAINVWVTLHMCSSHIIWSYDKKDQVILSVNPIGNVISPKPLRFPL